MIVSGNTGEGVYDDSADVQKFIDVSAVKELHEWLQVILS